MKKLVYMLLALAIATPAYAEDQIIVTARKFEESVQDSPVSITYLDEDRLEARGAGTVSDIPGIGEKRIIMSGDALLLSMRGQTQNIIDITTDSSVSTYLDGVYVARGYGLNTNLLDVSNVQVLYGPQGTLFGRNSTGGALLIETNDPVLGAPVVEALASYNDGNDSSGTLIINMPLTEHVALRAAGYIEDETAWIEDRITGNTYGSKRTYNGRIKLRYSPSSNLDSVVSFEHYRSSGDTYPRFMDYGFGNTAALANMNPGDTVAVDVQPFNRTEITSVSADVKYTNLQVVGGYRRVQSNHVGDWDGTPLDLYKQRIDADVEQYTIDANYRDSIGRVSYTLGTFYFEENGTELGEARLYGGYSHSQFLADIDNRSYGVYLSTNTKLTDRLVFNASTRYTHDDKNVTTYNRAISAGGVCIGAGVLQDGCASSQNVNFDKVTWSVGLDYHLEDHMIYAKVGTGYKSGGNQNRSLSNVNVHFKPEDIIEGEVGIKGSVGNTDYSLSAFYNEVDNYQILTVYPTPIVHTMIVNAAKTRSYGGELNVTTLLQDNIIIHGNAQFVNPKFVEYSSPITGSDLTSNRFNNVTKFQFTVDGTYVLDRYRFNVSYTWRQSTAQASQSREYLTAVYGETEAQKIMDITTIPDHGILNASVVANFDPITITLFGNNLTNTRYRSSNSFNEGLWNTSTWNNDRSYGVKVGFKF